MNFGVLLPEVQSLGQSFDILIRSRRPLKSLCINTALGLGIAIVAIFFHLILSGMAKKIVTDLEGFSMKLENFLVLQVRSNPNLAAAAAQDPRGKK